LPLASFLSPSARRRKSNCFRFGSGWLSSGPELSCFVQHFRQWQCSARRRSKLLPSWTAMGWGNSRPWHQTHLPYTRRRSTGLAARLPNSRKLFRMAGVTAPTLMPRRTHAACETQSRGTSAICALCTLRAFMAALPQGGAPRETRMHSQPLEKSLRVLQHGLDRSLPTPAWQQLRWRSVRVHFSILK